MVEKAFHLLQPIDASEVLYEKLDYVITSDKPFVALYPGKFKPPHAGHLGVVKELANNHGVSKVKVINFAAPPQRNNCRTSLRKFGNSFSRDWCGQTK